MQRPNLRRRHRAAEVGAALWPVQRKAQARRLMALC
jgi:hypothetical protein